MGIITIEVPQNVRKNYRIALKKSCREVIEGVDNLVKNSSRTTAKAILGLWADRTESVDEIARTLRAGWDRSKKNG